jgi:transcriptional regulator with XRE-family HTH domain
MIKSMLEPTRELRKLMKREDLTQNQVAEAIGVSPPFLSAVMRGKKPATPKILEYLKLERYVGYRRVNGSKA